MSDSIDLKEVERFKPYTDVNYLSPNGFRRKMGFNNIDRFWESIAYYRDSNRLDIPLTCLATQGNLRLTVTEPLKEKYNRFNALLNDFKAKWDEIAKDSLEKEEATRLAESKILSYIDEMEESLCGERSIKAIVGGYYSEDDPKKAIVANYYRLLEVLPDLIDENDLSPEDFLGEAMQILLDTDDLDTFYRDSDPHLSYLTDTTPQFATYRSITRYLQSLWGLANDNSIPSWFKVFLAGYYITYIKPFSLEKGHDHNLAMASALMHYFLHDSPLYSIACILPVEACLIFTSEFKNFEDSEIRKNGDFTYFLLYAIDTLTPVIEGLLDELTHNHSTSIAKEAVAIPKEEIEEIYIGEKEEEKEEPPVATPEPTKEKKPTTVSKEVMEASEYELPIDTGENALNVVKKGAGSEKNAKEVAKYLLETHPLIRKGQANFYATHRTLGRYYTIQDFKKATKCAYETARTSMDLLTSEGFYTKLRVKNKYVYTPVKIGKIGE